MIKRKFSFNFRTLYFDNKKGNLYIKNQAKLIKVSSKKAKKRNQKKTNKPHQVKKEPYEESSFKEEKIIG